MKAAPLALATLALLAAAREAKAEDTVRVCIAASTEGQTLRKQGKLLAAHDAMIACARDACPAIVRSHCARWLSEVDAAIPSLVVRAQDASGADVLGARLAIDGRPAKLDGQPVQLDPGEHVIAIEGNGGRQVRQEEHVLLLEGEASRRVTLRFPAAGAGGANGGANAGAPLGDKADAGSPSVEPSKGERHIATGAWILGGVGIVSLGLGTYFALAASSQLNDLNATCSPHCTQAETQSGRTDALLFDVLVGVGGAAVAGALVWAFAFPSYSHVPASRSAVLSRSPFSRAPRFELRPLSGGAFTSITVAY
jgi:hypothetical protein